MFINDPLKCTNVEKYEGALSIYEKNSNTIKAYDSLLVFPTKWDLSIIETECTYFTEKMGKAAQTKLVANQAKLQKNATSRQTSS